MHTCKNYFRIHQSIFALYIIDKFSLSFVYHVIHVPSLVNLHLQGRRSSGHVYRQPANQMIVTTATQQNYPAQYPAQPYNQYQPVQGQTYVPPQGYVQHPPPPQGGYPPVQQAPPQGAYPPVQQAPPLTGSGYPPQETKAQPSGKFLQYGRRWLLNRQWWIQKFEKGGMLRKGGDNPLKLKIAKFKVFWVRNLDFYWYFIVNFLQKGGAWAPL
jgi:hypothetical protein